VALQFEARKVALKQDRTGYVLTLSLHPDEIPEELLRDFVGARYGCALVRIQDDESATQYNNRVQKAGMLCRNPQFHAYIQERFAFADVDEIAAANILCTVCEIDSRSELNGNIRAHALFDDLLREFEEWRLRNDPF
jgi:hypothetical protein